MVETSSHRNHVLRSYATTTTRQTIIIDPGGRPHDLVMLFCGLVQIHLGDVTTELRKVTAERDYFKEEALGNALTSIYDTPFTPIRFDG
jgi:hypothetical protein